jgi:DNA end-binding protein Ku
VRDKAIVLQTMLWPDEVREPDFEILDAEVDLRPQEQKMAASLVESLGADFDADQFHDEYREAVAALIERKKTTGEARPAPIAPAPTDDAGDSMTDLLTALQRSVEAAKAASGRPDEPEPEPAPKKAPARRSSTKKKADDDDKPAARKRTRKPA